MRTLHLAALCVLLAAPVPARSQTGPEAKPAEPFKLGTFEIADEPRIGIVLQDKIIIDLHAANRVLERNAAYPAMAMPEEMRDLVGQYEYGLKYRIYEIVNDVVSRGRLTAKPRPG